MTVLKADISGSTLLGERLDPEELRAVLGSYFTALVREIHRRGGSVDKFVGDAVIAVFGVPDARHDDAERAVVAAVAMQEAIERENVSLQGRYGVSLACRIGVATGEVVVGAIAGDVQAGETVVGEPVMLAEALESAAALGSVLVSPATRDAARRAVRFGEREDVVPKGSATPLPAYRVAGLKQEARELLTASRLSAAGASLQVGSERPHVLAEERKVVTVLFADVSPSQPLGERLTLPEMRAELASVFGALARAIQHYGGTIDKYIGDAVMAVFGAPVSHDDDAIRALYSAVAIRTAIAQASADLHARHGITLGLRIGVNTGEVVAGLMPGEVLAYTVTGDAVNTAQRIESGAPQGDIYASETTYALARSMFEAEPRPPLVLKGKEAPVPVYRVIGRRETVAQAGTTPFVGRGDELVQLGRLAAASLAGHGRIAHVHGDAGVGKSRLIAEVLAGVPASVLRLRARCNSFEEATPYAVVADIIRRTFDLQPGEDERVAEAHVAQGLAPLALPTHDSAVALLLELMGYGERSPLSPDAKRAFLISLLRVVLAARSVGGLVIVIEDLHWMDGASASALAATVGDIATLPCFVMTTSRQPNVPWPAERLELQPVDERSAGQIIEHAYGAKLDQTTLALLLERAGGNPFFLEELAHTVATRGTASVPATVQEVLEARLDALEAEPRLVVQRAAVVGRTFSRNVLARIVHDVPLKDALGTLERERFIRLRGTGPEPEYVFSHALVQEVVYRTQLVSSRRTTHEQVGDAITALYAGRLDEFVDVLAYHYRLGPDDQKARDALLRAGQRAQHLYANEQALDYYRAAVERSAADGSARATAHEGIGDVDRVTGDYLGAIASYERARDTSGPVDGIRTARLERKTGVIHHLRGETDTALRVFEEVLGHLPAGSERARTLQNIGEVRWRQGRYREAVESLLAATDEAGRSSDLDALAEASKQLGSAYLLNGDLDKAVRCYEQSLALYMDLGDALGQANALNNIGAAYRRQSRHVEALDAYERALEKRRRIGDQLGIAHSRNNLGEIHYLRGDLAKAEENFAEAATIASAIGYVGLARVGLGATRVARGDVARGRADLQEAVRELEQADNRTYLADALRDLAISYLGDDDAAAAAWAERAAGLATELGSKEKLGAALRILGRARRACGDLATATATLERSLDLLRGATERQELARTLAELARAYRDLPAADERWHRAGALEAEARAIFSALGAELDRQRMDAT